MKIKLRIYAPNNSKSVTLDEEEILTAFKAYMIFSGDIDTNAKYEIVIEETTI